MATTADGTYYFDPTTDTSQADDPGVSFSANDSTAGEANAQAVYNSNPAAFQSESTQSTSDSSTQAVTDAYAAALATTGLNLWGGEARSVANSQSPESSWIDSAMKKAKDLWGWAGETKNQKNPLLMMALTGIANAQKNSNEREMNDKKLQNNIDVVNAQYANQRKTAEENSAAISSLPKKPGIIQGVLKRIDGTPVFNSNGTVRS